MFNETDPLLARYYKPTIWFWILITFDILYLVSLIMLCACHDVIYGDVWKLGVCGIPISPIVFILVFGVPCVLSNIVCIVLKFYVTYKQDRVGSVLTPYVLTAS